MNPAVIEQPVKNPVFQPLEWDVKETPIHVNNEVVDTHKALVHSTNKNIIAIHKASYSPMHNAEFKTIVEDFCKERGIKYHIKYGTKKVDNTSTVKIFKKEPLVSFQIPKQRLLIEA